MPVAPVTITFACDPIHAHVAELAYEGAIQLALRRVVDVLDARVGDPQLRLAQRPREALVVAREVLGVDEHPEALVEVDLVGIFGSSRCAVHAAAIAPRRSAWSFSIVGSVSMSSPFVSGSSRARARSRA